MQNHLKQAIGHKEDKFEKIKDLFLDNNRLNSKNRVFYF